VVICPGRGSFGARDLGTLAARFPDAALLARLDALRRAGGRETLTRLDAAPAFDPARHGQGDHASALIFAVTLGDALSLAEVQVVAVTGNSMGWYSALAVAGALTADDGLRLADTLGGLMQDAMIGGQIIYPVTGEDWRDDPARRAAVLDVVAAIGASPGHELALSIDLGGMLVVAGDEAGLSAFAAAVPPAGKFPLRLAGHAAFHTPLQAPVAVQARAALPAATFRAPLVPLVDGRGHVWWPGACLPADLHAYTLGHQVTAAYDFTAAIRTAAREFAPDLFVIAGPGTGMAAPVAQALIRARWRGLSCRADLDARAPFILSMAVPDHRRLVTAGAPP
jgi:acyl transferase domain-containing protein